MKQKNVMKPTERVRLRFSVFGGRRVVMSFRCSEELKRAFVPVAKHFFGSVCRPFEAFMASILMAVNERVNFGDTVRIEKLVVERNLRPRRYSRGSSYGEPEANMYDPRLCDWVFVSDAVLNESGHAFGCGCKVCSGRSHAREMGETARKKRSQHLTLNEKGRREPLFQHLDSVLKVASKKFRTDSRENSEKIRWGRLIIQAVHEYGYLLKSEEIEIRLSELEEKLKHGVLIPDGSEQATKRTRR